MWQMTASYLIPLMRAWMRLIHPYFVVPASGIYSHIRSFRIGLVETKKQQKRRRHVVLVRLTGGCSGAFGELLNWPVGKHEDDNMRHFSGDKITRRLTRYLTPYEARATVSLQDKTRNTAEVLKDDWRLPPQRRLLIMKSWGRHDMNHCHAMIHPTYSRRKKLYLDFCPVCVKAAARISLLESGRPRRCILDQRARNPHQEMSLFIQLEAN